MNRIRKTMSLSVAAGSLLAIAAAGGVAAAAPENAGCVGQFASTGGTTAGAGFGALISGAARFYDSFGTVIVRVEAHGERGDCPFSYPPD
jgi:hypothetical protein